MTGLRRAKTRRTITMNYEGEFKTLTKDQIIAFLNMQSMKELKMEEIIRFLNENSVKD